MKTEYTLSCPLCGNTSCNHLFTVDRADLSARYAVLRCYDCQLIYIARPPTEDELCRFYQAKEMSAYTRNKRWQEWNAGHRFVPQIQLIERYTRVGNILDVGCSDGLFLRTARARGWDTCGVELSQKSSEIARERHSLDIITGTLHSARFPDDHFGVVAIGHLLEHLSNPLDLLVKANRVLKDGGLIFIAVPLLDDQVYRLITLLPIRRLRNKIVKVMGAIDPPEHLITFSSYALARALEISGFTVLETVYYTRIRPFFMNKKSWLLGIVCSPLMRMLDSGLYGGVLARKVSRK